MLHTLRRTGSTVWTVQVQFIVIITCHGIENAYLHTSMVRMASIRSLAPGMWMAKVGGSGVINCLQHISICDVSRATQLDHQSQTA